MQKISWSSLSFTTLGSPTKKLREKIIVEKYKGKTKRMDGSHSQTRRVARSNFRMDGRWKKSPGMTTVTIHESGFRRPIIEEDHQRQGSMEIVANQSLDWRKR